MPFAHILTGSEAKDSVTEDFRLTLEHLQLKRGAVGPADGLGGSPPATIKDRLSRADARHGTGLLVTHYCDQRLNGLNGVLSRKVADLHRQFGSAAGIARFTGRPRPQRDCFRLCSEWPPGRYCSLPTGGKGLRFTGALRTCETEYGGTVPNPGAAPASLAGVKGAYGADTQAGHGEWSFPLLSDPVNRANHRAQRPRGF